jgi:hypothetical protein
LLEVDVIPNGGASFADKWNVASTKAQVAWRECLQEWWSQTMWNIEPKAEGGACIPSSVTAGDGKESISWTYSGSTLSMSAALHQTDLYGVSTAVAAYPDLIYGWSPYA